MKDKLYLNVLRTVEQFVSGRNYRPMTKSEILEKLKIPKQHDALLQAILKNLIAESTLKLKGGKYHSTTDRENEALRALIRVHPRGFGFAIVENSEDVFIPRHLMMGAIDGDTVDIEVNPHMTSDKGPEGKVVRIVSRGRKNLAGIVDTDLYGNDFLIYVPLLGREKEVLVRAEGFKLKIGDRIYTEVVEWGDDQIVVKPLKVFGHISDPSIDNEAAIIEFGLRNRFSDEAREEALSYGKSVKKQDLANREDFSKEETFTIDPDTAKDFDDALSLKKDEKGHYHLGVHIADVSHYVKPESALDLEASLRLNSTYFPNFCLPMLPHELSDNLCSLKEKVIRLTISVLVEFDPSGNMVGYRTCRSYIKSQKRFTYKEAKAVLDGKKKSIHKPTLELMVELTHLMKKKRFERGSIEFSLPELVLKIDEKGVPIETEAVYYDITHQLVEEFMLKANELVALHIANSGKHLTYRIHDIPAEENMKDFALMAEAFGFKLPYKPQPEDLQKLFIEAQESPHGPYLAANYIRRMKLALYSADNIGHYGLALSHYCHFTSPIRRYVDLAAHRILFGENQERKHLEFISDQASQQERISAKAEMSVLALKKLRYAEKKKREDGQKEYDAVITKIKPFGLFFEVVELMIEGFIHISEVGSDYYFYDDNNQRLVGENTREMFALGDKATVLLDKIDLIHQEASWRLVKPKKKKKKK